MATPVVRTTYALDAETVQRLDQLAKQWQLSRSAALRKLVADAWQASESDVERKLAALRRFQESMSHLTDEQIADWRRTIREEREAQTDRIEKRWREAAQKASQ